MKQTFFKLFSLLLLGMVAGGAQAATYNYKNIFVRMNVVPTGAGKIYMAAKSGDDRQETSKESDSVDFKATISKDTEKINDVEYDRYWCNLYADPDPGFDFEGFYKKNDQGEDVLIGTTNPLKVNVDVDGRSTDTDRQKVINSGWEENPDHEFFAKFKTLDTSVNNFTVGYYQPAFSGGQDEDFGTCDSELIDEGAKVRLTANPKPRMRFIRWYNALDEELSTDEEMIVKNVNSTYKMEFDLDSITLPAELSTYSFNIQTRFDDWNKEGLTAYKVTAVNDKLTLVQVEHAGANDGVILQGVANKKYEMSYQGLFYGEDNSDNLLKGTANGPVDANGNIFVLANGNHGVGFYKLKDGEQVPLNKAYLEITNASRDFIGFDTDETTSITSTSDTPTSTPIIYNMAGQRVNDSYNGLVIQNGRKYIRK